MEALFGTVAINRRSPKGNNNNNSSHQISPQTFILDPRKSQNIAIILRSLTLSRKEILDALIDGEGLDADNLEKLLRVAPTKVEESEILSFSGDPTRLADAESFLYHLLKAVPTAFTRLNAMLFRKSYKADIINLKETIQTLELGCKELRTRGLFLKLLEAILKAGNRMNAGTSRGNAQAFNLTALRKLSDVKSADGKTTLLHFVVEEVVRSEGKRCVLNRNQRMSRNGTTDHNNSTQKLDREKEFIILGLPMVGGLSAEFSNVKKAATIDYDAFSATCFDLTTHAEDVRQLVAECSSSGGRFVEEMRRFLEAAEQELKVAREEQRKVIDLVKRTTSYFQARELNHKGGASSLQLFVIVKDFLDMVDQVCVKIARDMQNRKSVGAAGSSSPRSMKFPNLPAHFMSDQSRTSSSNSDSDF